jgi:hemerythrin-like domain-containing protein
MDTLTRLSGEHAQLHAHLERIQRAAEGRNDEALRAALNAARELLTDGLDTHIALEEAEVFAIIEEVLGEDVVESFREEHGEARVLRDDVLAALDHGEAPHGAALELCTLILTHQQREDLVLFPSLSG